MKTERLILCFCLFLPARLSALEEAVVEGEVIQMALNFIRTGGIPVKRGQ